MKRTRRAVCATVFALEERALQATLAPGLPPVPQTDTVSFMALGTSQSNEATQQVSQQSGAATVILGRSSSVGALQVQVTTDPTSPYVGVNVGAVNQTVTFANGQDGAALTVPIIAGAPNPGEVDVNLTITPVNPTPGLSVGWPLELRVLASDASVPPTIVAANGTPQAIELIFSQPMDPVQASNVKNYAVYTDVVRNHGIYNPLALLAPLASTTVTPTLVPLKSAQYNAATNTVTLIPRRHVSYSPPPIVTEGNPAHAAGRANAAAGAAHGLVDLRGDPINPNTTPGKFRLVVGEGYNVIRPQQSSAESGLLKMGLHASTHHFQLGI
jgi:hypothetical protein